MNKRIMNGFLVLTMTLSLIPTMSFAAAAAVATPIGESLSSLKKFRLIKRHNSWAGLAIQQVLPFYMML